MKPIAIALFLAVSIIVIGTAAVTMFMFIKEQLGMNFVYGVMMILIWIGYEKCRKGLR